jgi:hypothetical protein
MASKAVRLTSTICFLTQGTKARGHCDKSRSTKALLSDVIRARSAAAVYDSATDRRKNQLMPIKVAMLQRKQIYCGAAWMVILLN